mgnify:CR=1 FL=1
MELIKRQIQNYTWKVKNVMQFTLDDTINVPENLLDIEKLVLVKGNVVIEETQAMVDRFQVKGNLNYQILYLADKESNTFDSLSGKVPFVEYINADGTKETDYIEVHASLNDLTVTMLHSRKLSLRALVGIDYQVKEIETFDAVTAIEEEDGAEVLSGNISMMTLTVQDKKSLNVEEQVEIPGNKPDIYQVIWKSMNITNPQIKSEDGYLLINGNLSVFLVYTAEEEGMPVQYFTMEVPFERRLDVNGSTADMISGSVLSLDNYHITVIPDDQGQDRILELCADFTVEIKLYGEEELKLVQDAYSTDVMIEPVWKEFSLQHLLMRNCAKTRISETIDMPKNQSVLQICYTEGSVSIDETMRTPKGISVDGVLSAQVTYLNKDDNGTLASDTFDIPFTSEIEVNGMDQDVTYSIVPFIDQIQAVQMSDSQIEIKAEISLELLAFANGREKAVLNMDIKPVDFNDKMRLPGITCYVVKVGDTLWSIAKRYYTTVNRIKEINRLESDMIYPGDKLVILKE